MIIAQYDLIFLTQYAYPLKKYKMIKNMDHMKTICKKEEEKKHGSCEKAKNNKQNS